MSDKIKACYDIEDNKSAFSCVKQEVKVSDAPCRARIVLLVQENCTGCKQEKDNLKEDISSGLITSIDINTEEGIRIARDNDIDAVPAILVLDCHDRMIV